MNEFINFPWSLSTYFLFCSVQSSAEHVGLIEICKKKRHLQCFALFAFTRFMLLICCGVVCAPAIALPVVVDHRRCEEPVCANCAASEHRWQGQTHCARRGHHFKVSTESCSRDEKPRVLWAQKRRKVRCPQCSLRHLRNASYYVDTRKESNQTCDKLKCGWYGETIDNIIYFVRRSSSYAIMFSTGYKIGSRHIEQHCHQQ